MPDEPPRKIVQIRKRISGNECLASHFELFRHKGHEAMEELLVSNHRPEIKPDRMYLLRVSLEEVDN